MRNKADYYYFHHWGCMGSAVGMVPISSTGGGGNGDGSGSRYPFGIFPPLATGALSMCCVYAGNDDLGKGVNFKTGPFLYPDYCLA